MEENFYKHLIKSFKEQNEQEKERKQKERDTQFEELLSSLSLNKCDTPAIGQDKLDSLINFCNDALNGWSSMIVYKKGGSAADRCMQMLLEGSKSPKEKVVDFLTQLQLEVTNFSSFPGGDDILELMLNFLKTLFQKNSAQIFSRQVSAKAEEVLEEIRQEENSALTF